MSELPQSRCVLRQEQQEDTGDEVIENHLKYIPGNGVNEFGPRLMLLLLININVI